MAENAPYLDASLEIFRDNIRNESVDLIDLDPLNSKVNYYVLFCSPKGHESHAQITAFGFAWHRGEQAETDRRGRKMNALRHFLSKNDIIACEEGAWE
jgi:hypothetical protein